MRDQLEEYQRRDREEAVRIADDHTAAHSESEEGTYIYLLFSLEFEYGFQGAQMAEQRSIDAVPAVLLGP